MNQILYDYDKNIRFTRDLKTDVSNLLKSYGHDETYVHCVDVAEEAVRIAEKFGEDTGKAKTAALLHDISAIIPKDKRIEYAEALKIDILPEEMAVPMLLHQKHSKVIARELFRILDEDTLNAIECHTTLRTKPTKMDLILFVADKVRWDQKDAPPFSDKMIKGLKKSLEEAFLAYAEYMFEDTSRMKIVHPWFKAAFEDLKCGLISSVL